MIIRILLSSGTKADSIDFTISRIRLKQSMLYEWKINGASLDNNLCFKPLILFAFKLIRFSIFNASAID